MTDTTVDGDDKVQYETSQTFDEPQFGPDEPEICSKCGNEVLVPVRFGNPRKSYCRDCAEIVLTDLVELIRRA